MMARLPNLPLLPVWLALLPHHLRRAARVMMNNDARVVA
jgi:hypothetical protein